MVAIVLLGSLSNYQNEIVKACLNQTYNFIEDAIIVNPFKTRKLLNLIDNPKAEIIDFSFSFDNFKGYKEYRKNIKDNFKDKFKIDNVILIKTPIAEGLSYDNYSLVQKILYKDIGVDFKNNRMLNFQMLKKYFEKIIFVKALSDLKIRVFQFVIDPQEVDFSKVNGLPFPAGYKRLFILKNEQAKYCPMYEYYLQTNAKRRESSQKLFDLFFIASVVGQERSWLISLSEKVNSIADKQRDMKIIFRIFDSKGNRNNRISQTEYYKKIGQSRYTLIIPPYDIKSFSIIRFFEAVNFGCIPLIYYKCNLKELEETFKDIYEIILRNKLIVTEDEMFERISGSSKEDINVINEIIESKSYRKITNSEKVKIFYNKLLYSGRED